MKDLTIGDRVYGPSEQDVYEITRHIGGGNFGTVFEVQNEKGEQFALKTISTAGLDEQSFRALIHEGDATPQVQHPNVIRVLFFHDGEKYPSLPPYMITEYADEGTLEDFLDELRKSNRLLTPDELRAVFIPLAQGMKAINEKFVHRDIKPDNIFRLRGEWKIADFGLSKVVGAATRTQSQTFKGINHVMYCAPEAWKMEQNLPSMDMYSMGVTFFEIATLRNPYNVANQGNVIEAWKNAHFRQEPLDPRTLNPGLDLGLAQLILKMIAKRPEDRYANWDEVINRLEAGSSPSPTGRNVNALVGRALEAQRKAEQARLEAERIKASKEEFQGLVEYSFGEIVRAATEIVETFNQASDFAKLKMSPAYPISGWSLGFIIYAEHPGPKRGEVWIFVVPVYEEYKLNNQAIKAWGYVKAPSKKGFNLLLVSQGPEDMYGKWKTLEVEHSPLLRQPTDSRVAPFPFELSELPEQIPLLNALGVFQTKQDDFRPDMLDPLIAELIQ